MREPTTCTGCFNEGSRESTSITQYFTVLDRFHLTVTFVERVKHVASKQRRARKSRRVKVLLDPPGWCHSSDSHLRDSTQNC